MPIPASLIASIISTVIETAMPASPAVDTAQYQHYAVTRTLPPEARQGVMLPPKGDGLVSIDGHGLPLSAAAQFRNERNLIVQPMSIRQATEVVYLVDPTGKVHRIWLLSAPEASSLSTN